MKISASGKNDRVVCRKCGNDSFDLESEWIGERNSKVDKKTVGWYKVHAECDKCHNRSIHWESERGETVLSV